MSDLLPCPFCGWVAEVKTLPDGMYYVQCSGCQAATDQADAPQHVIDYWNRRTPLSD